MPHKQITTRETNKLEVATDKDITGNKIATSKIYIFQWISLNWPY